MTEGGFQFGPKLSEYVDKIVASYDADARIRHVGQVYLPDRVEIVRLVRKLLELIYPGFVGRRNLTPNNVARHVGDLLPEIGELTYRQVLHSLCHVDETENPDASPGKPCAAKAEQVSFAFIDAIPAIREMLAADVQAVRDGDPAVLNMDEVILACPGLLAISVQRLAHALYALDVPIMPRIMTEWAHSKTGIDIHPGARIGRHFFIDHGTGVVIGETTVIGEHVKVYQGVTLGALSIPRDDRGRAIRKTKRHPTVKDNVTLYANAIVLGGETVIGENSVIGGSVFVTSSVPPNSVVTFKPPELRLKNRTSPESPRPPAGQPGYMPDYTI